MWHSLLFCGCFLQLKYRSYGLIHWRIHRCMQQFQLFDIHLIIIFTITINPASFRFDLNSFVLVTPLRREHYFLLVCILHITSVYNVFLIRTCYISVNDRKMIVKTSYFTIKICVFVNCIRFRGLIILCKFDPSESKMLNNSLTTPLILICLLI